MIGEMSIVNFMCLHNDFAPLNKGVELYYESGSNFHPYTMKAGLDRCKKSQTLMLENV
jgi:hypothetical protein